MYPESNIWITGHSLGGALATLLGVSFGAPAVAFESPGDKLASTRLHLPQPVSKLLTLNDGVCLILYISLLRKNTSHTSIILLIQQQWAHATESSHPALLQATR